MSRGLFRAAIVAVLALALFFGWRAWTDWQRGYDPQTVVAASLEGLKEQNVLVPFTARYVAVVTSTQNRLGLSAKKTLIMPGTVRYELDLGRLKQSDLDWDGATNALTVTLPPLRLAGPEIDIDAISEYRDGEILLTLTDAEASLDAANRKAAQDWLADYKKAEGDGFLFDSEVGEIVEPIK